MPLHRAGLPVGRQLPAGKNRGTRPVVPGAGRSGGHRPQPFTDRRLRRLPAHHGRAPGGERPHVGNRQKFPPMKKALFIDRDGTVIAEPPADYQVDSLEKLEFIPGAISALRTLRGLDFELVMATNQDGLGTEAFPEEDFRPPHEKMLRTLAGEGTDFIIADLRKACELMKSTSDLPEGRVGVEGAYAFMARVALFEGTWQKFRSNIARGKELCGIAADAANAEDRHARVLQGLHGRVAEQQFGSGERIEHGEMFLRTVDSRRRAVQIMIQRIAYRVNRLLRHFRRIPAAG